MNSASPIARTWRTPPACRVETHLDARLFALILCAALCQAQPPQQKSRDLKYEEDRPTTPQVTIPRGYALVIGIAKYKNLPAKAQLDYAERDAESVYSVPSTPKAAISEPRTSIA